MAIRSSCPNCGRNILESDGDNCRHCGVSFSQVVLNLIRRLKK